jgi:enoyl-CoA hydratase/carnithine racemase
MSNVLELENVKIERDGGITFIILNRPEKRNAMSPSGHERRAGLGGRR